MEWEELVRSLGRFGLTEREAAIYLALLRRGRATARELAKDASVDRVLGYRTLDVLRGRGVVETTAERPRRFVATQPAALFERVLRERRAEADRDEILARDLSAHLAPVSAPEVSGAPRYQILSGVNRVHDYLREMVGRGQTEIRTMLTYRSFRESADLGLPGRVGEFLTRGGRFHLIVEGDPRLTATLKPYRRSFRRFASAEIRTLLPQPTRVTLVDGREAMLFLVPESRHKSTDQVAVWTDNPAFVAGQSQYFDAQWRSARPFHW
jgi:DNA-binding MarR family transcriptional regulator